MEDAAHIGPYKATRLWNDVVFAFRQYMPCVRHRRYMKTFDNCFSGASATEWLLQYLKTNGNFGSDVSREKATSLINKLYRAGIIDEVKVSKTMRHKQDIQENRLYKFLPVSPSKMKISRLPLAPINDAGVNHQLLNVKTLQRRYNFQEETKQELFIESDVPGKINHSKIARKISILRRDKSHKEINKENEEVHPACHLVSRVLTTTEIKDTWKIAFVLRCRRILGLKSLTDVISSDLVDGYNVMHNCIYLNKSGIVTNIEAKEQLPHWVMSAMKCLARWPEPPEPGLPNYPGFEKDVFGVVKDYFLGLDQPLVPHSLYNVVTNVFVITGSSQPRHSSPHRYGSESSIPSTLWSSASLENIIMNLTKKYCLLDNTSNRCGTNEDLQFSNKSSDGFSNYNSAKYNSNACLSTDEMDKLEQNNIEVNSFLTVSPNSLTNQACPSMPIYQNKNGPTRLSTTAPSTKKVFTRSDKWLSGISRKYGSAPNLKVSRFETVFGPDNRTVTRVFYQNGMTTDYGHDDEVCVCLQGESGGNDSVRAQSTNCLYDNDTHFQSNTYLTGRSIVRSKSFVHLNENTKQNVSTEKNMKLNTSFSGNSVSSSFSGDICRAGQNKNDSSLITNRSSKAFDELNNLCSAFKPLEDITEKSFLNSHHSLDCLHSNASPAVKNSPLSETLDTAALQEQYVCESRIISVNNLNSQCLPHHPSKTFNLSPFRYFSSNQERAPSLRRKPPLAGNYDNGYRHSAYSERTFPSLVAVKSTPSLFTHDYIQPQGLSCDSTNVKRLSLSTLSKYGPGYRPSGENPVVEYNIVLDASKKRSALSSTSLTSPQYPPSCQRIQSTISQAEKQMASRPYSLHCHDTSTLNEFDCVPGLNFSSISPFCNLNLQSTKKTHMSSLISYPTRLQEDKVKSFLQMVTLLLPPANRRKLHLLLKMMAKMTLNPNLCLDTTQTTRSLVLGTFYSVIIRSMEDCDLDKAIQFQLVSFMLDYYDDIFTPPSDMKTHVSDRLKALQRPQVVYSPKPERTVRFCQQTSVTDFENQRVFSSHTALENLLEDIISDKNMKMKEKQKRLEQFQRTYPAIYKHRFPDTKSEANVLPQKAKLKEPLIRLKSLRL